MTAHNHGREESGRYTSPAWWCPRCETPHWHGSPEEGCDDCGFHQKVLP